MGVHKNSTCWNTSAECSNIWRRFPGSPRQIILSIGYADKWISDEVITEVFVDFTVRMRQRESELY